MKVEKTFENRIACCFYFPTKIIGCVRYKDVNLACIFMRCQKIVSAVTIIRYKSISNIGAAMYGGSTKKHPLLAVVRYII